MSRLGLALLSAVAVAASALSASAAAAVKFEWSINGTPLAAGVKSTVLIKPDGTIIIRGTAFGVATELETSAFTEVGANIQGGKPGTGEGVRRYEKIRVVRPKNCEVPNITTNNIAATVVEGATSKTALVLLKPIGTSVFAAFTYQGASCPLLDDDVNVTGSVLLEPLSTTEKLLQLWTYLPPGKESVSSTGTSTVNNLELAGGGKVQPVTISGTVGVLLDVDAPWLAL